MWIIQKMIIVLSGLFKVYGTHVLYMKAILLTH